MVGTNVLYNDVECAVSARVAGGGGGGVKGRGAAINKIH